MKDSGGEVSEGIWLVRRITSVDSVSRLNEDTM